ncbi:peptidyl-prolyl cis-trans isomerase [Geomonas oryzae]|uniref:peptidyl-prolyl cis-trans isomerase n=1 Tax=Geomonas oryzae TaxID=2364273 RepID=UPI00100A85CA|nr:peptidyl-prolyl cis-trans isomerase [Geomonas oryzae]
MNMNAMQIFLITALCAGTPAWAGEAATTAGKAQSAPAAPSRETAPERVSGEKGKAETQKEGITVLLQAPAFSPRFAQTPVALVNDDPILMQEFTDALGSIHEGTGSGGDAKAGKKDYQSVLDRLVSARLIIAEGFNMGLDELPEAKKGVSDFSASSLGEILKRRRLEGLKPDQKVVDRIYQDLVTEWKIRSVKFDKKDDAAKLAEQLKAGGKFDALADQLIDAGKVQGGKEGEWVQPKGLLPQIAQALSGLKGGEVTAVLPVGPAFTLVELQEIRFPKGNNQALEEASQRALELKGNEVLAQYWKDLEKKYVTLHKKVLDKLDFEAPRPGFDKLLKDRRVVAEIRGEKPITVGDLAAAIRGKFFHGIGEAIKIKKVNEGKVPALEDMLLARVFRMEAMKQGIDRSDEYKNANKKYRDSIVFGMFIDKVVVPEIKVTNGEVEDYYRAHVADYSSPEMIKLKELVFAKSEDAESAAEKLRKGAEFQWLSANAAGQVPAGSDGRLEFGDTPWITKKLAPEVQLALAGAKGGDFRLYTSPEGYCYVLAVQDVIPAKPAPLDSARKEIAKKLYGEKVNKSIEVWGEKLRKAYQVKLYLAEQAK